MIITSWEQTEKTDKKTGLYFDKNGLYKVDSSIKTNIIFNNPNAE